MLVRTHESMARDLVAGDRRGREAVGGDEGIHRGKRVEAHPRVHLAGRRDSGHADKRRALITVKRACLA